MPDVNWLAVLAAAISAFLLGGLWYSPALFQKTWQRAAGLMIDPPIHLRTLPGCAMVIGRKPADK